MRRMSVQSFAGAKRALWELSSVHARQAVVTFVEDDAPANVRACWEALGWSPVTSAAPVWPPQPPAPALHVDKARSRKEALALLLEEHPGWGSAEQLEAWGSRLPNGRVAYVHSTGVMLTDEREPTDDPGLLAVHLGGQISPIDEKYVDRLVANSLFRAAGLRWGDALPQHQLDDKEYARCLADGVFLLPRRWRDRECFCYGFVDWRSFHTFAAKLEGPIPMPKPVGYDLAFEFRPSGLEILRRHERDSLVLAHGRAGWLHCRPDNRSYLLILDPDGGPLPDLEAQAYEVCSEEDPWR
jgi:hypothetical protein